jgi:rhodanese-related sulfurtransferase
METKPRSLKRLSPPEVKSLMDEGKKFTFIDARNEQEWADSDKKIAGAMRVPLSELEQQLPAIPKAQPIITYCT